MNIKRRLLSQNFLKDPQLVKNLVGMAHFGRNDTVVEIGAGKGIITQELAKTCGKVIAVEIDAELVVELKRRFAALPNVEIYLADIRQFSLPNAPYKVFSNTPFHLATDVVYKLLYYSTPPSESYLILPKEAVEKFSGLPHETQFSVLAKPWFEFKTLASLARSDFSPEPDVDTCLLKITQRQLPLISPEEETVYKSFIKFAFGAWKKDLKVGLKRVFTYNQWKRLAHNHGFNIHARPTDLNFAQWLEIFRFFAREINPARYRGLM